MVNPMNYGAQLPMVVSDGWDWQIRAACRGMDASMFFHPENERGSSRRRREDKAKRVCSDCPVRRECLGWALSVHEPYGIWGGLSPTERDELFAAVGGNGVPIAAAS